MGVEEGSVTPTKDSPDTCQCERVSLVGPYSAGPLVKCSDCHEISRSLDRNSCPRGTKLFSPRSRTDWQTVIDSAGPLRDPHWIIDVTKPSDGSSTNILSSVDSSGWETSDDSPW